MKNNCFIFCLLAFVFTTITPVSAQTFEFRARKKTGTIIAIDIRCTSGTAPTTADFITDVVFGIKWATTYNVDLSSSLTTTYNITKSGSRSTNGSYHYQAFYANNIPFNTPSDWLVNSWVEVLSVANTANSSTATGTFEICETGFNATTNPSFGRNGAYYVPTINGIASDVVVPLELVDFKAKANEKRIVALTWIAQNEHDIAAYQIERSATAKDWQPIGNVTPLNHTTATSSYQFDDLTAATTTEQTLYYRLWITEIDGKTHYSPVKSVQFGEGQKQYRLYPNPAMQGIYIERQSGTSAVAMDLKIAFVDITGRIVAVQTVKSPIDTPVFAPFDIKMIQAGKYFVRLSSAGEYVETYPLVVVR